MPEPAAPLHNTVPAYRSHLSGMCAVCGLWSGATTCCTSRSTFRTHALDSLGTGGQALDSLGTGGQALYSLGTGGQAGESLGPRGQTWTSRGWTGRRTRHLSTSMRCRRHVAQVVWLSRPQPAKGAKAQDTQDLKLQREDQQDRLWKDWEEGSQSWQLCYVNSKCRRPLDIR